MTHVPILAALVIAVTVGLAACAAPRNDRTADTPTQSTAVPSTLGALVNRRGPIQITYRWTGPNSSGDGPGTEVWRIDGPLARWDAITRNELPARAGSFLTIKDVDDDTINIGCRWTFAAPSAASVRINDCGQDVTSGSIIEGILGLAFSFLRTMPIMPDGSRTVLGTRLTCYRGQTIEQVCTNDDGYVLYFSVRHGDTRTRTVLEATDITTKVEPFEWPGQSLTTPTGIGGIDRSVNELKLPSAIHVVD